LPHVADSFHTVHSAKLHRHGELTDDMYHIKEGPHNFCKHVNTPYELPVISLPALESPHSGGAEKNFFHYIIRFSVQQLYIHVQLPFKTSSINLTDIYIYIYIYTGCPRRKGPNFGRVFLRSNYTDITQNTHIQSSMVTEILAREK